MNKENNIEENNLQLLDKIQDLDIFPGIILKEEEKLLLIKFIEEENKKEINYKNNKDRLEKLLIKFFENTEIRYINVSKDKNIIKIMTKEIFKYLNENNKITEEVGRNWNNYQKQHNIHIDDLSYRKNKKNNKTLSTNLNKYSLYDDETDDEFESNIDYRDEGMWYKVQLFNK